MSNNAVLPPPQSLAAYAATRVSVPAQLGRTTLYRAAEVCDAVSNVRICCQHSFQLAGMQLPEHYAKRLADALPPGDRLTLAQAARVLTLWQRWTRAADFPDVSAVTGFIFALNR